MFSRDTWKEIFDTIRKNKLRTFLTGFTMALGIFIVVILVGFTNGLQNTFEKFFGDFGKISLILGSSFISKESADGVTFATSNDYDPSIANDLLERSVYDITSENSWDFKAIYE